MHWSDIQFDPPRKSVSPQFAGLWLLFFGAMAILGNRGARAKWVWGDSCCSRRHDRLHWG